MAYFPPQQDLNAKYATANAELNQLYALATAQLPVAPDAVIQSLIMCRTSLTGLTPGQTQPNPAPGSAASPASAAPLMQHPPEPEALNIPAISMSMYQPPAMYGSAQQTMPATPMAGYAPPAAQPMSQALSGHAHGGAPPMPPAVLMPQGTYPSVTPQSVAPPPEQANFTRREDGWPPRSYHKSLGEAIYQSQETPGNVRHEVIIEKRCIGRILGKGGRDLAAMKESSGAEVFIIDKEPPPGVDEDHRMLIIIGTPDNVNSCLITVNKTLERARNELPPLPPPLSSGWRPVPSATADTGWMQDQRDGGRKRGWDGR